MSEPINEFEVRRAQLAAQISRQRTELRVAYYELEKPLRYAERGMTAVSFIRQNPWVFVAVPTGLNILFSIFGLRRKPAKPVPGAVQGIPNPAENSRSLVAVWGGRAVQLYQLYRRVRPYFLL